MNSGTAHGWPRATCRWRLPEFGRSGAPRRDDGFSLIEVLVAMVIFALIATSVSTVLVQTSGGARNNEHRVMAANIASTYIEAARSLPLTELTDSVISRTEVINNRTFQVTREVSALSESNQKMGICEVVIPATVFKKVTVAVTWAGMGNVPPVRAETRRSIGLSDSSGLATTGILDGRVVDGQGNPLSNVSVVVNPGSGASVATDSRGCYVFSGLPAAPEGTPYTVTATAPMGYVRPGGGKTASESTSAVPGVVTDNADIIFVPAATVTFTVPGSEPVFPFVYVAMKNNATPGFVVPSTCPTADDAMCQTGVPGVGRNVPTGMSQFSGTLCESDPSFPVFPVSHNVVPGANTVQIPMARITVDSKDLLGFTDYSLYNLWITAYCDGDRPVIWSNVGTWYTGNVFPPWHRKLTVQLPPGKYALEARGYALDKLWARKIITVTDDTPASYVLRNLIIEAP